jgi:hypothetical protein
MKDYPLFVKLIFVIFWNSDIRIKDSYGTANQFASGMLTNQGGESPVYLT